MAAEAQHRDYGLVLARCAGGVTGAGTWLAFPAMICRICAAMVASTLSRLVTLCDTPFGSGAGSYAVPAVFSWKP
jgi:hypothetical protein